MNYKQGMLTFFTTYEIWSEIVSSQCINGAYYEVKPI